MTDRIYIDPASRELLLMTAAGSRWQPDTGTMTAWREGHTRLYRIGDVAIATMPDMRIWTVMTPTEASRIDHLLARPWIPETTPIEVPRAVTPEELAHIDESAPRSGGRALAPWPIAPPPTASVLSSMGAMLDMAAEAQTIPSVQPLPKHVADLMIRDAESRGEACPITMEPIKIGASAVTSCGHIFDRTALTEWFGSHATCPQCRQPCAKI